MISIHVIGDVASPLVAEGDYTFWLGGVIRSEGYSCGELNIVFCNDSYLLSLNKEYLGHDYFTDIITFEYSTGNELVGDLYISLDRVKENAVLFEVSFDEELKRVCVHGVLHLCGYRDKISKDLDQMRSKENFYLEKFVSRET